MSKQILLCPHGQLPNIKNPNLYNPEQVTQSITSATPLSNHMKQECKTKWHLTGAFPFSPLLKTPQLCWQKPLYISLFCSLIP